MSHASHAANPTPRHIRGSTLLLLGRAISLSLNFTVQVLTVRYLSKLDYGSFAFAFSLVELGSVFAALGMNQAISRFAPIYHEVKDYPKMFGSILLALGTTLGLGLILVALVWGLHGPVSRFIEIDPLALTVLTTLILLVPLNAFDAVLVELLAAFAGPRSIFLRRHVLGPGLKLVAVATVILSHGGVRLFAVGYLCAAALGVSLYTVLLFRVLHRRGLLRHLDFRALKIPARQIFTFSTPLLGTNVAFLFRTSLLVLFLEHFHGAASVAEFRAVLPIARMNEVVLVSFAYLFTPIAARLFAQKDRLMLNHLYWRTAIWIMVLSFPLFAVSFALARPLTVLLFGDGYADSASILAVLAFAYFFQSCLGFNGGTLKVLGKVKRIVVIDAFATLVAIVLNLLLIPRYGALGGAVAAGVAMVVHTLCEQVGLIRITHIRPFEPRYAKAYASIGLCTLVLLQIHLAETPPAVGLAVAAFLSLGVAVLNRDLLEAESVFPELFKVPWMRRLFGSARRGTSTARGVT